MLNVEHVWYWNKLREIFSFEQMKSISSQPIRLKDPVCGKLIKEPKYAGAMVRDGSIKYYFCSMECKTKFLKEPEKYLSEIIN